MAKRRRDNREQQQTAFLQALALGETVKSAALVAGVDRTTVYAWRKADEAFAREWAEAYDIGTSTLEDEAQRRAVQGVDEPIYYQGRKCGDTRKYSDTMLMFLLKARVPEKYCDRARTALLMRRWVKDDAEANSEQSNFSIPPEGITMLDELAAFKASKSKPN